MFRMTPSLSSTNALPEGSLAVSSGIQRTTLNPSAVRKGEAKRDECVAKAEALPILPSKKAT
jgi:hypothetical protein